MKYKKILILILLVIVVVLILAKDYLSTIDWTSLTPQKIKEFILGFRPWALGVYIALYAMNTVSLLPPIGLMSLAAGFIFGPLKGTIGLMIGSFLGTTVTFFISRNLGGPFVEKMIKGKAKDIQNKLDQNGFKVILFMRLIPIFPWEVINYASGLSKIKYRDYILATMIGILPAVLVQTFFTDRLAHFNVKDPTLLIAVVAFILLGAIPAIYLKRKKKEGVR